MLHPALPARPVARAGRPRRTRCQDRATTAGTALLVIDETREALLPMVLRPELHAGAAPPVVLLAHDLLISTTSDVVADDGTTPPHPDELKVSELEAAPPPALRAVRGLY